MNNRNILEGYASMPAPARQTQVPARIDKIKNAIAEHLDLLKKLEGRLLVVSHPPGAYTGGAEPPAPVKQDEELVGLAKDMEEILRMISEADTAVNSMLQRLEL